MCEALVCPTIKCNMTHTVSSSAQAKVPSVSPILTTVIPTFRRPSLLQRAVESAASQATSFPFTVDVFDNASSDHTGDVVAALRDEFANVRYTCREHNIGATANFTRAVASVESPYFSLLSDDDYVLPGFYERAVAALEREPQAAFWAGVTLAVGPDQKIWFARGLDYPCDGVYPAGDGAVRMTGGRAPTWTGIVFRTSAVTAAGFIDCRTGGPSDLDFLLRLACRYPYMVERVPVAVFSLNPSSFSATQPLESFWPGWQQLIANAALEPDIERDVRDRLLAALARDARRMLFRRGLHAAANRRRRFASDASAALIQDCRAPVAGWVVHLAALFARPALSAGLMRAAYRGIERFLVASRQKRVAYAHLLQPVATDPLLATGDSTPSSEESPAP